MLSMDQRRQGLNSSVGGGHKLFSTQLEKELKEFEGRGSKTPRNYLPGKSNFPKVLLTSNPLVERDLQKKLSHINYGRSRRQKVWEWNQRHFLVSQIFDPEYNLRFTKGLVKYSDQWNYDVGKTKDEKRNHSLSTNNNGIVNESERHIGGGLGVFMPPLHPSQRLIEKQKIPPQSKLTNVGASTLNLSTKKDKDKTFPREGTETNLDKHLSKQNHIFELYRRQNTTIGMTNAKNGRATLALAAPKVSSSQSSRKVSKSVSLPEIPLYKSKTEYDIQRGSNIRFDTSSDKESYVDNKSEDDKEILCNEHVLDGITRSLPLSVMIKANQNINKEVQKRKAKMIEKCKSERDKDTFADPRWIELNKVLVNPDTQSNLF